MYQVKRECTKELAEMLKNVVDGDMIVEFVDEMISDTGVKQIIEAVVGCTSVAAVMTRTKGMLDVEPTVKVVPGGKALVVACGNVLYFNEAEKRMTLRSRINSDKAILDNRYVGGSFAEVKEYLKGLPHFRAVLDNEVFREFVEECLGRA